MGRLPGASVPSADRAAALLLLASEAWVGVSSRLRTPPSTVLAGGLRATRPENNHPKKNRTKKPRRIEWARTGDDKVKQRSYVSVRL